MPLSGTSEEEMSVNDLNKELKTRLRAVLTTIINGAFLFMWVAVQVGVAYAIRWVSLDEWLNWAFRIVFAVSTLAVVIIYTYVDVIVIWIRAKEKIEREREQVYHKDKNTKDTGTG